MPIIVETTIITSTIPAHPAPFGLMPYFAANSLDGVLGLFEAYPSPFAVQLDGSDFLLALQESEDLTFKAVQLDANVFQRFIASSGDWLSRCNCFDGILGILEFRSLSLAGKV